MLIMLKDKGFSIFIFLTTITFIFIFSFILSNSAHANSNISNQHNDSNKNGKLNKEYYAENKKYLILNLSPHLKGYIYKKIKKYIIIILKQSDIITGMKEYGLILNI